MVVFALPLDVMLIIVTNTTHSEETHKEHTKMIITHDELEVHVRRSTMERRSALPDDS